MPFVDTAISVLAGSWYSSALAIAIVVALIILILWIMVKTGSDSSGSYMWVSGVIGAVAIGIYAGLGWVYFPKKSSVLSSSSLVGELTGLV